jgi:fatty acid desaturase
MGVLEYSFNVSITAYSRAAEVGKRYPKLRRTFFAFALMTLSITGALVWYRPMQGLFLFVLPMIGTLLFTSWVTYDHHAGLESDSHFEASYNIMNRWFNVVTGNLGYHTAHHYKQGVHWSDLPELHAKIQHKIPAHLFRKSTFDVFLPDEQTAAATTSHPAE